MPRFLFARAKARKAEEYAKAYDEYCRAIAPFTQALRKAESEVATKHPNAYAPGFEGITKATIDFIRDDLDNVGPFREAYRKAQAEATIIWEARRLKARNDYKRAKRRALMAKARRTGSKDA